jgi:predicted TIM-barrel fold metal-dependent hydrolase
MWGSDYPHPESTYPKSLEITSRVLADVPEPEREKILAANTARVFGIEYRHH